METKLVPNNYKPNPPEDPDDACTDCGNEYVYEVDCFPGQGKLYRTGYCQGMRQICAYCVNGLKYGELPDEKED